MVSRKRDAACSAPPMSCILKPGRIGAAMTERLVSPRFPGGPKPATGSATICLGRCRLRDGGSSDRSALSAARRNSVWSASQSRGTMNSNPFFLSRHRLKPPTGKSTSSRSSRACLPPSRPSRPLVMPAKLLTSPMLRPVRPPNTMRRLLGREPPHATVCTGSVGLGPGAGEGGGTAPSSAPPSFVDRTYRLRRGEALSPPPPPDCRQVRSAVAARGLACVGRRPSSGAAAIFMAIMASASGR
mmetsp:Transcript_45596/g.116639  ORF Transcript_45596/g.116639 Transcript_45596/m.116639 type:complete len:243 (+) Transcript_45596:424-1152(+)